MVDKVLKISVITVSYNSDKTIRDTFESVFNQSYDDIDYIVVDGQSTDRTVDIIREFEGKFQNSNKNFRWISEKDNGIYDAINKGIKMSTGDVVGILNSDDYYTDNSVVSDIAKSFIDNRCDCLYGNLKYIDPDTKKVVRDWKSKSFRKGLFEKSWTPAHPTFYCKKTIYEQYGLYRTDLKIAADVELMYRYLEIKSVASNYLDRYFVTMRQGGISSSGIKSTITITKEMMKAFNYNGKRLNLLKYLFYKGLKLKEFIGKS